MVLVEQTHHVLKDPAVRGIVVHQDLLGNDAPLLLHGFLREIRRGDKGQQQFQAAVKMLRAGEIVGGGVIAGEGVGIGPQGGEFGAHIPVGHIEHLVLQIVGNALGRLIFHPVQGEFRMDGAVGGHEIGHLPPETRLGADDDLQAVGQAPAVKPLIQHGIIRPCHWPTPFSRNSVCSRRLRATRATSPAVTARMRSIYSGISQSIPLTAAVP